jgi:regulatory protein
MRITSITRPPRKRRYEVLIDHVLLLPLSPEVLATANLRTGQDISDTRLHTLEETEARHSAQAAAMRMLASGPRSEREVRHGLARKRTRPDLIDETIARLRDLHLLNDAEFARTYVEARDRRSPRGRRLLRAELSSRGVTRAAADEHLASIDEPDAAYRAASRRARSLAALDYPAFQRRLGDHLIRRGFPHETAREAIRRAWENHHPDTDPPDEQLD